MSEDLDHMVDIDDVIDDLVEMFDELEESIDKIDPANVPQTAARDRMREIVEGAFKPYLAEFIQCNQVFEQGAE